MKEFKMGRVWLKLFMTQKKINKGWKTKKISENEIVVIRPNGEELGVWNSVTGILRSKEHIMNVQP
jgi:hypothetical protein